MTDIAAPPLRVLIHARLRERPWLTAEEIARTIERKVTPAGVMRVLRQMEGDGESGAPGADPH